MMFSLPTIRQVDLYHLKPWFRLVTMAIALDILPQIYKPSGQPSRWFIPHLWHLFWLIIMHIALCILPLNVLNFMHSVVVFVHITSYGLTCSHIIYLTIYFGPFLYFVTSTRALPTLLTFLYQFVCYFFQIEPSRQLDYTSTPSLYSELKSTFALTSLFFLTSSSGGLHDYAPHIYGWIIFLVHLYSITAVI